MYSGGIYIYRTALLLDDTQNPKYHHPEYHAAKRLSTYGIHPTPYDYIQNPPPSYEDPPFSTKMPLLPSPLPSVSLLPSLLASASTSHSPKKLPRVFQHSIKIQTIRLFITGPIPTGSRSFGCGGGEGQKGRVADWYPNRSHAGVVVDRLDKYLFRLGCHWGGLRRM